MTVFFFHPLRRRSRTNAAMRAAVEGTPGIALRDVYEMYPDFGIDVAAEQAALVRTDVIVLQHPMYWYSCPALMKEWIDAVLEWGWAYGPQGTALEGKHWLQAFTSGGPEESYRREGVNRFTIAELVRPFEQTARLCGMRPLRPFVVHGSRSLDEAGRRLAGERYRKLLEEAREWRLPPLADTGHVAEARHRE